MFFEYTDAEKDTEYWAPWAVWIREKTQILTEMALQYLHSALYYKSTFYPGMLQNVKQQHYLCLYFK